MPGVSQRCDVRGLVFDLSLDRSIPAPVVEALRGLAAGPSAATRAPAFSCGIERDDFPDRVWKAVFDGRVVTAQPSLGVVLDTFFYFLNRRVIEADDELLSIHAACVALDSAAILLPAESGAGKSTLCARLLRTGSSYLTDESVGLGPSGQVFGYAKPLGVKEGSREALPEVEFDAFRFDSRPQAVWYLPPSLLSNELAATARATVIGFPRFEAGSGLRVDRVPRPEAAMRVLEHAQNLDAVGADLGVRLVAELVVGADAVRLVYGDARHAAAALVERLTSAPSGPPGSWRLVGAGTATGTADPTPVGDVVAACFTDGALLVRGSTGEMLTTDAVGAMIWPLLGTAPLGELVGRLSRHFGVDRNEIASGLTPWLEELRRRGFVVSAGRRDPSGTEA